MGHRAITVQATSMEVPKLVFSLKTAAHPGALIRLSASGISMLGGLRVERVTHEGIALPIVHRYVREEMEQHWGWHIETKSMAVVRIEPSLFPNGLPPGAEIAVEALYTDPGRKDDPGAAGAGPGYSGLSWTMSMGQTKAAAIEDAGSRFFDPVAEPVAIAFVPGPPERVEAYLKPDGRVIAAHFDALGNPSGRYSGTLVVSSSGGSKSVRKVSAEATITIPPDPPGASGPDVNTGRFTVRDDVGRTAASNAVPQALDGTPVFFGEIHWHTDFSCDGQRPLREALKSARDELCLDFAGPADHMSSSGAYGKGTPDEQAEICRSFDEPGRFCTIPGAELSGRYGHANIHADSFETFLQIVGRFEKDLSPAWDAEPHRYALDPVIRLCPEGRALVVPHHSNMDSFVREHVVREDGRPFWCAMHFPIPADRGTLRLFEMVQSRGAFETEEADNAWRILDGGLGGSARTALARGYRVGFVSGTDNHCGWPTRLGAGYSGVTAVQSPRLDRKSIFAAMYRRRCYSSSGARIVADATLNGQPMGSELRLEPGAERRFCIRIRGTSALTSVQMIHCGYTLADFVVGRDTTDFDIQWVDERPGRPLEDAYYYVRARQADGHCVWLSPFWVDLAD